MINELFLKDNIIANSIFIATGSNLGDKAKNLLTAKNYLNEKFNLIKESRIYASKAVDYLDQPDFYNQVLQFQLNNLSPGEGLKFIQSIEEVMERKKIIPKGPRNIDIDIIFWSNLLIDRPELTIPHPSWHLRSFVCLPLIDILGDQIPLKFFNKNFNVKAYPL